MSAAVTSRVAPGVLAGLGTKGYWSALSAGTREGAGVGAGAGVGTVSAREGGGGGTEDAVRSQATDATTPPKMASPVIVRRSAARVLSRCWIIRESYLSGRPD